MNIQEKPFVRVLVMPILRRILPRHRPAAVVIGGGKGGTTSLYHYLNHHPKVVTTKGKELDFFNADLNYSRGEKFYHSNFRLKIPLSQTVSLDISPGYISNGAVAAQRIRDYDPNMKIIALLRNPVEAAYSDYKMQIRQWKLSRDYWIEYRRGIWSEEWLEEAIPRSPHFGENFADDFNEELSQIQANRRVHFPFLSATRYFTHIQRYYELFPQEQIKLFRSEEFFADPVVILSQIEEYLEIPHFDWSGVTLKSHNQGDYKRRIPAEARDLLSRFYEPEVIELEKLTGMKFNWKL